MLGEIAIWAITFILIVAWAFVCVNFFAKHDKVAQERERLQAEKKKQ
jgi:Tfp pilus assembly protein PilO